MTLCYVPSELPHTHKDTHTNETTVTPKRHIVTKGACCRLAGWPDGYSEGPRTERGDTVIPGRVVTTR